MTKRTTSPCTDNEISAALADVDTMEAIALKLWWGWIPMVGQKNWIRPGHVGKEATKMDSEEIQWFKDH